MDNLALMAVFPRSTEYLVDELDRVPAFVRTAIDTQYLHVDLLLVHDSFCANDRS
jgi:hypothetical protein